MDVNMLLETLKKEPDFAQRVGMILIHNGVIRASSRKSPKPVKEVHVRSDLEKIQSICHEKEHEPGIFRILAQANSGCLKPGDNALLLIVAGDIRENVKRTFASLLDAIKKEAISKEEIFFD